MHCFRNFLLFAIIFILPCCLGPNRYQDIKQNYLERIEVEEIRSVEGVNFLRNMRGLLGSQQKQISNHTDYILKANLRYSETPLIIKMNSDTMLEQVILTVNFKLMSKSTDKVIYQDSFSIDSDYHISDSLYGSYMDRQDERVCLASSAAESVYQRLLLFFVKQ